MMGVHVRTAGEIEAQAKKQHRRYASSIGKQLCQLSRAGRLCQGESVEVIADLHVCRYHSDLITAIRHDAEARRNVVRRRSVAA